MRQSNQPAEQNDNNKNNDGRFLLKAGGEVRFMKHYVTNGTEKARVFYTLDNRVDGRKVVTIYDKDYGHALGRIFGDEYENRTDTMTDYFDKGTVRLFENHPLYAAARARAEAVEADRKAKRATH